MKSINLGHPLIAKELRVVNNFNIEGISNIVLVTGSNMSGKTTFLRTIGVNQILACIGAPVCANQYTFSSWSLYTSMRISDSLAENTSSFYAELKRLKAIIDSAKNPQKSNPPS